MNIKNLKAELENTYKYRIELHAHTTPVSPCSEIIPEEMVKTYHEKGYDGIVITNHFSNYVFKGMSEEESFDFYLKDFYDTKKIGEKYGLKVYLGIEIRFYEENMNEVIVYGANEDTVKYSLGYINSNYKEFRSNFPDNKSVFIQAHPFRDNMEDFDVNLVDGIEVFNMHPGHNSRIGIAAKHAKENNVKIVTCGSDYHHPNRRHEAVSAIRTKILPKDSYEIADILKSGDYLLEIGNQSIILP